MWHLLKDTIFGPGLTCRSDRIPSTSTINIKQDKQYPCKFGLVMNIPNYK